MNWNEKEKLSIDDFCPSPLKDSNERQRQKPRAYSVLVVGTLEMALVVPAHAQSTTPQMGMALYSLPAISHKSFS